MPFVIQDATELREKLKSEQAEYLTDLILTEQRLHEVETQIRLLSPECDPGWDENANQI